MGKQVVLNGSVMEERKRKVWEGTFLTSSNLWPKTFLQSPQSSAEAQRKSDTMEEVRKPGRFLFKIEQRSEVDSNELLFLWNM